MFQNVSTQNVNFQSKNSNDWVHARLNGASARAQVFGEKIKDEQGRAGPFRLHCNAKERINYVYIVGNVILNLTIQKKTTMLIIVYSI